MAKSGSSTVQLQPDVGAEAKIEGAETEIGEEEESYHFLSSSWTLWYHHPECDDWTLSSYKRVVDFQTVEEFWTIWEHLEEKYFFLGMFFIMRHGIKPIWEDTANISGGCWSFKVGRKFVYQTWVELAMALVGNTLQVEPITATTTEIQPSLVVNGISISPKKGFSIVKVWNNLSQYSDLTLLSDKIPNIILKDGIYKAFTENS